MSTDDEVWPIALPFLTRDFLERLASERDVAPEVLAAEMVEAGVRAERVKAGVAVALSIACPRCKAKAGDACVRGGGRRPGKQGGYGRTFAGAPHSRRIVLARTVREHGRIGSEF